MDEYARTGEAEGRPVLASLEDMWEGVVRRLRDPLFWNDAVQLAKTVLAAVLAWLVATVGFDLSQPFLAPWAALLVVHATVYRTFSRGLQQVSAAVVAVFVASAVGHAMGPTTAAVAAVLVICLLLGSLRWFGDEATTVATTGLVVLTTGFTDDAMLFSRCSTRGSASWSDCSSTSPCGRRCARVPHSRPWTASTTASVS